MKKLLFFSALQLIFMISLRAQPVSDYQYKLDNGATIRSENAWNQVWVQQVYSPIAATDQTPLGVNSRTLGDLISGSTYTLLSKGKEVKLKGLAPGTYDLKMSFRLSGTPGTLSFVIGNIIIKPKTKTKVDITLYDYHIGIDEAKMALTGKAAFETVFQRCKASTTNDNITGVPVFYNKGDRSSPVNPDESTGKTKGKIKPGTYDVLLNVSIAGRTQKIWVENLQMKPDMSYKITANLNAGGIVYTGGSRDVKAMHLYPAGTSAKQTAPAPVKTLEIINYTNITDINCCLPGTFDVLLHKNGDKYEWRKNVAVTTGSKTEIK